MVHCYDKKIYSFTCWQIVYEKKVTHHKPDKNETFLQAACTTVLSVDGGTDAVNLILFSSGYYFYFYYFYYIRGGSHRKPRTHSCKISTHETQQSSLISSESPAVSFCLCLDPHTPSLQVIICLALLIIRVTIWTPRHTSLLLSLYKLFCLPVTCWEQLRAYLTRITTLAHCIMF